MKVLKKIGKITGITIGVLVLLAFTIPIVFKKQITRLVKKEINKNLTANVDFSGVRLNLLKHFPKVTIMLKDLSIVGDEKFTGDTLLYARSVDASANLFSVLRGKNIKIFGAYFEQPRIRALVNKQGDMNWDIAKKGGKSGDSSASAFRVSLKKYSIHDGYILYQDDLNNTWSEWKNVNHTGSGDITQEEFTLSTITHAENASFIQDAIPYLANTHTEILSDIRINTKTQTYTFHTGKILLNDLELSLAGFVQMVNKNTWNMDIRFDSPGNEFRKILSLVPDIYKQDFKNLKTSGDAKFNGFVKGIYSPDQFPAYDVNLWVRNGYFKYPDLPSPVKNVQLQLRASNPDGAPDHAVIDISKGHIEMDNEPFDFTFIYKRPVTAKYIDATAKGKIDLSQLKRFIKLPQGTEVTGLIWSDAYLKGNMSAIQNLQPVVAGGFFETRNLYYKSNDFPQPIRNGQLRATLENKGGIADNTIINISSGHLEVGNDPVDFTLQVSQPFSKMNFSGSAKGRFNLDHIKQFTKQEPGTDISGILQTDLRFAGNKAAINNREYDKITLDGSVDINQVKYRSPGYPSGIFIESSQLDFNPKTVTLKQLSANYLHTNFSATGVLNNLVGYLVNQDVLSGNLDITTDKMNLDEWIGTGSPATNPDQPASADPFLVPAALQLTLRANAQEVHYDKVDYQNVRGLLILNEEKITLKDIRTQALDGNILINGSYSTRLNKKEPDIGFSYEITGMDVQKAFYAFNTIQFLMPIGKWLSGKLNSQLSLVGNLDGNMMPKLNSLTGKGNLLLLKGVLAKFAPLEKLATVLQIDRLKQISLKEIKNYIEFANGKVLVKPFTLQIDNIEMLISGFHGFDQSIDYAIKMKLPRSVMGKKGNDYVNGLASKLNDKGIPLTLGETINLDIKMTGTISNPFIGINLQGMVDDVVKDMEQQARDFVQAKIDSAKQKARDSLELVKKIMEEKLKDKLKEQIFGKDTTSIPDSNQKKPLKVIKNTFKDILHLKKKTDTLN